MTPTLPNVTHVVLIGDRLIVLGADSGMTDAAYRRRRPENNAGGSARAADRQR
jgi:hypothetical protein